jgi:hypothetical protein
MATTISGIMLGSDVPHFEELPVMCLSSMDGSIVNALCDTMYVFSKQFLHIYILYRNKYMYYEQLFNKHYQQLAFTYDHDGYYAPQITAHPGSTYIPVYSLHI